jgi:hypothetical protein
MNNDAMVKPMMLKLILGAMSVYIDSDKTTHGKRWRNFASP